MAANSLDVRVKLGIESKGLRDGLRKAQQETEEFKRKSKAAYKTAGKAAGDSFGSIIALAKKFAPAISAGAAAMAVVNKAMKENQTLTDEWGRITESAKASYEGFVNTLVKGDFSNFFSNMKAIVTSAREAYDALDAIGTADIFYNKSMAESELAIRKARLVIKSPDSTAEERKAAGLLIQSEQEKQIAKSKEMADIFMQGFATKLAEQLTAGGLRVSSDSLVTTENGRVVPKAGSLYDKYYRDLETYTQWDTAYRKEREARGFFWNGKAWIKGEGALIGKGKGNMSDAEFNELAVVMERSDEKLQEAFDLLMKAWQTENAVLTKSIENIEYINKASGLTGGGAGGKKIEPKPMEGSIAYLEQKRSEAQEQFNMAVDEEARKVARALIDSLTEQIEKLSAYNAPNLASSGISALSLRGDYQFTPLASIGKAEMIPIENFRFTQEELAEGMEILNDVFSHTTSIISGLNNKTLKANQVLGQIFNIIGGVLTRLGVGGAATGTLISGFGTLIGGFATGGIVGGTSYRGDHLTAQVSSGEMILNRQQQRNLFNMLQGGGSSPADIAARVSGEQLIITINNTLRRQGKTTIG